MNKRIFSAFLFIILVATASWAANCPQVDTLRGISMPNETPNSRSVAVDIATGKIYVTSWFDSKLTVYSRSGSALKSVTVSNPDGVAVDGNGMVYVSRSDTSNPFKVKGEVIIYDGSLNRVGNLGIGLGEFARPTAIATDATRVYVADAETQLVKAYDINTRQYLGISFGGYKPGVDGGLFKPQGLAISPITGNIIVTDRALWWDAQNVVWTYGAGVHEFTRDGVFVRRMGTYGSSTQVPGILFNTAGVAVDSSGRIYVADPTLEQIQVFAPDGTAVCMLQGVSMPKGMTYLPDGRLLAASASGVSVLGLDDYVLMQVSPTQIAFEGQSCGGANPTRTITITNAGKGVLTWSISNNNEWLSPAATGGQINGAGSVTVDIQALTASLAQGSYSGGLDVSYQGGLERVSASLQVLAPPTLSVSPQSLSFSASGALAPPSQTLVVELLGDSSGTLRWQASTSTPWISLSPVSGDSNVPGSVSVSVDSTGLASGRHEGSIAVSGCSSAATVPVTFDYTANGSITVSTNIAEATFTITGPRSFTGSGTSSTFADAPEGTYTITFGDVAGFRKPASYSLDVAAGQTVTFAGNYIDLRRRLDIAAAPASSSMSALLRLFDGEAGQALGSFILSPDDKYQSVAAGDVDGDGVDEILITLSSRTTEESDRVEAYEADGTPVAGLSFLPDVGSLRVNLAAGDVDGDGTDEIIVAAAEGQGVVPTVKVFKYEGGVIYDTGISFAAYKGYYGTKISAGDTDGDGVDEIVTMNGEDVGRLWVGIWKAQGQTAVRAGSFVVNTELLRSKKVVLSARPSLAVADLNADGVAEILLSASGEPSTGQNYVHTFSSGGVRLSRFIVTSMRGVALAAGDTDFDGLAEIAVGDGPSKSNPGRVRLFRPDGTLKLEIKAFDSFGANISLGRFE